VPWPVLKAIEGVTPSSGETLRGCALRLAFGRDPSSSWARVPSTWGLLGDAAHGVAELAARGGLDACPSEPEARAVAEAHWDAVIEQGCACIRAIEAPLADPPPPARWPAYELSRLRAVRQALTDYRRPQVTQGPAGTPPEVELWLQDPETPLGGRLDRLEHHGDGLHLVDLKSAVRGHDGLRPGYRRQLLLYSHLVHRVRGEWPAWVGIRYLDGQQDVLDLVPAEADRVAFETLALREDFNLRVARGELEGLAAPSAESCAFCDYLCLCEPFFAAVQPDWQLGRTAVLGEVAEVVTSESAAHLQLLARACSRDDGTGPVTLRGLPLQLAPAQGTLVAFSRLRSNATASTLTVSWDSRLSLWRGPTDE
jgi:hypothetical protein